MATDIIKYKTTIISSYYLFTFVKPEENKFIIDILYWPQINILLFYNRSI